MARTKRLCQHARMFCHSFRQTLPGMPHKTMVDVTKSHAKCHACHLNREVPCLPRKKNMSSSTTPATQSEGGCRQVPCLPRKVKVGVAKCRQVPRLPRKVPRRHRASRRQSGAQARHWSQPSVISATRGHAKCR